MKYRTSSLSGFGHREFEINLDPQGLLEIDGLIVENALGEIVRAGSELRPTETIQFGWSLCRVVDGREFLGLEEPDFAEFPINWVPDIHQTLMHLRIQTYTAESVGLKEEQDHPSILQSAIVCNQLRNGSRLFMERTPHRTDTSDSGWSVLCSDSKHDHQDGSLLSRVSLYAAFLQHRGLSSFVSLPEGSKVLEHQGGLPHIFLNDRPLEIKSGSYLAAIIERRRES
jgi:hypothetical protein